MFDVLLIKNCLEELFEPLQLKFFFFQQSYNVMKMAKAK